MSVSEKVYGKLAFFRHYLQLTPFDTSTEAGRSDERHRRIALTALIMIGARVVSLVTPLVTIPMTLRYLGKEQYGLWMTLSSVTVSLTFADLGLGQGLLNAVAECNGKDDREGSREYVSSGFFLLAGIAVTLGLAYWIVRGMIPWEMMFGHLEAAQRVEITRLFSILFICFLLNMPLGIVDRIYLAFQEGYISSLFQMVGSVLTLCAVVCAVRFDLGLSGLILALSGTPLVVLALNGINLFARRRPWLLPDISLVRRNAIGKLLRLGLMFFVLQICYVLAYNSDNLVIAGTVGLNAVADYVAPSRLFAVFSSIIPLLLNPVWPAYIEAANRGDAEWVKRTLKRTVKLVIGVTLPANIFLLFAGNAIISFWTHGQISPSATLLRALAIWGVVGAVASTTSMFMNAMNVIAYQSIGASVMALLNLGLSIWISKRIGTSGVVWGSIISQSLMLIPTCTVVIPNVLAKLRNKALMQDSAIAV